MRYETVTIRHGENVGPVDWEHEMAKAMPPIWSEAEKAPSDFLLDYGNGGKQIVEICMYDGWPYWKPTPAILYVGPLGPEWAHFNSYGVNSGSIKRKG
jgi:hypothetical protein